METRAKKIAKLHDNPIENEEQVDVDKIVGDETSDNELSDMDKLPNEILMEILDHLYEKELVKCRLLNSRWNEICCKLLNDKMKNNYSSKLIVQLHKFRGHKRTLHCTTVKQRPLDAFLKCFSPSEAGKPSEYYRPIPFSRFFVKDFYYLNEAQILQIVSTFGPYMKFLTLDVKKQDCKNFIKFWNLLLKFAPNIQHLGIGGDNWLNKLDLFDSKTISGSFLQNLQCIQVAKDHGFGGFASFVNHLLDHAPNVKEVLSWPGYSVCNSNGLDVLEVCQRSGKPHLLKKLQITTLYSYAKNSPPAQLMNNVRLEFLYSPSCGFSHTAAAEVEKSTINYIHHALKSSQDTLSSLNLHYLNRESINFCFKDIKSLPNVRRLDLIFSYLVDVPYALERFSQLCPNTTNLQFGVIEDDFSNWARILWTGFKGLKFLKFSLDVDDTKNNSLVVDSAISGYSTESIQNIQAKLKQGISLEEARRGEVQNASILDLKDLSRIQLQFWMRKNTDDRKKRDLELRDSVFMKLLPQHIREQKTSIAIVLNCYVYYCFL